MRQDPAKELKSANRLAFEYYLRTGQRLSSAEWAARFEQKFNPYHDPDDGRFTSGPGGIQSLRMRVSDGAMTARPVVKKPAGPVGTGASSELSKKPLSAKRIAEVPGYSEGKRTDWRSTNNYAFEAAANYYNRKYGLRAGDRGYRTPEFLKAWAMRESGGEGDQEAFMTDPFQVNNFGDFTPKKIKVAGLRRDQRMTPAVSAYAALEWLRFKSIIHDGRGVAIGRHSEHRALERYNGRSDKSAQSGAEEHSAWYARTILEMTRQTEVKRDDYQ